MTNKGLYSIESILNNQCNNNCNNNNKKKIDNETIPNISITDSDDIQDKKCYNCIGSNSDSIHINQLPCLVLGHIFSQIFNGILPSHYYSNLSNVCRKWKLIMFKIVRKILLVEENYTSQTKKDVIESMVRVKDWFINAEFILSEFQRKSPVKEITLRIRLCDGEFTPLCHNLSECCSLIRLDLGLNTLGDTTAIQIANLLIKNSPVLELLNLEGNKITDEGMTEIAKALKFNQTLTKLNLSKNYFGPDSHVELVKSIMDHPALVHLEVKDTAVSSACSYYGELIKSSTSILEYLDMSGTCPGAHCKALFECLKANTHLKTLIFNNNNLFPHYLTFITDTVFLQKWFANTDAIHLEEVMLNNNELNDFGIYELSKIYQYPFRIRSVGLANNKLTFCGLSHLCFSLCKHKFLEKLDLSNNNLSDKAAPSLSYLFKNNSSLKEIHLRFCQLNGGMDDMCKSLEQNKTLTWLDLNCNRIDDKATYSLCQMLKVNCTLKTLSLGSNQISNASAEHLASCIKINNTITSMDLSNNHIDFQGALIIIDAMRFNHSILDINFFLTNIPRNPSLFLKKQPRDLNNNIHEIIRLNENNRLNSPPSPPFNNNNNNNSNGS
ncbi:hypothetical protein DLAC_04871 [Tieghemostelium lacteum]|uniref:Leucine-rich repeat-containing protein (LRR) n=1 Tax=Tieghemostelium lacteum TaxID=361077 RepID=A0A151ZIZ9_TIELA|nr:hypothetical protein DLAC_04871 [Tieghemostelium lacteum]|eukprot:KYQ93978.1 hypothetical protein DLAC_04871 [Tieghemostelium lacteum]